MFARGRYALLLSLLSALLVLRAAELRLPGMARQFWEDEIHHNEPVLASPTMEALRHNSMYLAMFQPLFDFWTRKVFWFPLLGANERALRVPALVCGLLLVPAVLVVLFAFLRRRMEPSWAVFIAFVAALWIVDNPTAIRMASEGRHYALITLASVLWFALLMLFDGKPRPLFTAVTLLFANTHFFALPLIAGGYLLQLFRELRARHYRWIPFHLVVCAAVYACTTTLNREPLLALLANPPDMVRPGHASLRAMFAVPILRDGLAVWLEFARTLALPIATAVLWLFVGVMALVRRRARWLPLLLCVWVGLPLFFTYMRFRSGYGFVPRYFVPFFGLGLVTIAAGIDVVLDEWRRVRMRFSARHRLVAGLAAIGAALLCGVPAFAFHLLGDLGALRLPPKNFSSAYFASREVVQDARPTLILHEHCWADDMQAIYYERFLPRARAPIQWIDVAGCPATPAQIRQRVQRFLDHAGPDRVVVIDRKEADCRGRPLPVVAPPVTIERFLSVSSCAWKLRGATTREQIADAAAALGFEAANTLR